MLGRRGKESIVDTDYSIWAFCYAHSTMPHDFFGGVLVNSNRGTLQIPMVYPQGRHRGPDRGTRP
ncbi:MAG: hypothetical protein CMM08_14500 [Rhodospirillaceae bacterium]|jgi:hypothetical protein|nr:hypothetical protein [Rhodospirillaceae bacterium]|tara:strand:- start:961 stop:1155 length:195 start_codon:yes stop_codon:yes gene_type:complete